MQGSEVEEAKEHQIVMLKEKRDLDRDMKICVVSRRLAEFLEVRKSQQHKQFHHQDQVNLCAQHCTFHLITPLTVSIVMLNCTKAM